MNWIKLSTFAAVFRFALPICATLLLALCASADDIADIEEHIRDDYKDKNGERFLVIGADGVDALTIETPPLHDLTDLNNLELVGIVIEKDGMLTLEPGAMLHLSGGYVEINGGTLVVSSVSGTGIYRTKDNEPWYWDENTAELIKPSELARTFFHIDGGTIEIEKGNSGRFVADTIDVILYDKGGEINVDDGVTFQSGNVFQYDEKIGMQETTATQGIREIKKTGDGTWEVGEISVNAGLLTVKEGHIVFLHHASIAKLDVWADTSITGSLVSGSTEADEGRKSSLTILEGGKVEGTLNNIGHLKLGNGTLKGTLEFVGGEHSIEEITIYDKTTLDLQADTKILLGTNDTAKSYSDLFIHGTLKISTDAKGFEKKNTGDQPVDSHITLNGGSIEIYKGETEDTFNAETIHLKIIELGEIVVNKGVIYEGGKVTSGPNDKPGLFIVSGGGTYLAKEVVLESSYQLLLLDEEETKEGTKMDVLGKVAAGMLIVDNSSTLTIREDAEFTAVQIEGTYKGDLNNQNNSLKILQGGLGRIGGTISEVKELILGKQTNLALNISERRPDTESPIISVEHWTLEEPGTTWIQVYGGMNAYYTNVLEISKDDSEKMEKLLNVLNESNTALYRPHWLLNPEDETFFDLDLTVYSVENYISKEWKRKGRNIENVGRLFDQIKTLRVNGNTIDFRAHLESLTDDQLRSAIRSTLAGELAGNALRFTMQQPANTVFRHLDGVNPIRSPFNRAVRGQVREGYNIWFSPFGQAEHASGDSGTFDGYNMSRYGFYLGSDIELYNRAVAGLLFGYTSPYMQSDLGKISANDYTAAAYLRMSLLDARQPSFECCPGEYESLGVMLNMMVGFGSQDYSYRNPASRSKFSGSSLFASVELTKKAALPFHFGYVTPLVAVDFQSASMDSFIVRDPYIGGILVEPDSLDSTAIRIGLLGGFIGGGMDRLRTRLQYSRQIAGHDYVSSSTSLVLDELGAATPVRSIHWGKDWLNVGVGYEVWATRHWRIFTDYDFDVGHRTTSHLGSINTVLRW